MTSIFEFEMNPPMPRFAQDVDNLFSMVINPMMKPEEDKPLTFDHILSENYLQIDAEPLSVEDHTEQSLTKEPEQTLTITEDDSEEYLPFKASPILTVCDKVVDESLFTEAKEAVSQGEMSTQFCHGKRKDVLLKTMLRKCRKQLQVRMCKLTGFVGSKKVKENDPFVSNLTQFTDFMKGIQTPDSKLDVLFYLGALLFP